MCPNSSLFYSPATEYTLLVLTFLLPKLSLVSTYQRFMVVESLHIATQHRTALTQEKSQQVCPMVMLESFCIFVKRRLIGIRP